jgi:hypothetical protein
MAPRIDKPLKREVELQGQLYTVTISPDGVRIVLKGKRSGAREMTWLELVSGEAELELDLVRSLAHGKPPPSSRRGNAGAVRVGKLYDRERANT